MSPTPHTDGQHRARAILQDIAQRPMIERGLLPIFSNSASAGRRNIHAPAAARDATGTAAPGICDLTGLAWASIDNDNSCDLGQLTVAEARDAATIRVAVAATECRRRIGESHRGLAARRPGRMARGARVRRRSCG